ncbi:hypothetical protein ACT6NV_06610 [Robiginitalea sp. IMCC44478]|uniref:hypothetical protein n=1 Tax=Robiginitalea sp. IMCC44478 TaxID=3459122 RepID=UPI00404102B8
MLKFFRQIRQKLLADNKFSKYLLYAVGEILLVVIGILIALQVDNWNEEIKENNALISILENEKISIAIEIEKEEAQIQEINGWIDTVLNAQIIIEEVDAPTPQQQKVLESAFEVLNYLGLRTRKIEDLQSLSQSISRSKLTGKNEVVRTISKLIDRYGYGKDLLDIHQENLFGHDRSLNGDVLWFNSKDEAVYNFELMKTDYKFQHYLTRSRRHKITSRNTGLKIVENYKLLSTQIEYLLKELEK